MPLSVDSPLHRATHDIIAAAADPQPFAPIEAALRGHTARFHALGTLVHEEADDEVLLHASPTLTIYHITLSPGLQYPPHNHLTTALVGIYVGSETNFLYPVVGRRLGPPQRQDLLAPAVLHMRPHAVHSVANTGHARSGGLHVYLGDLTRIRRQMWALEGGDARPFDNGRYLAGARKL